MLQVHWQGTVHHTIKLITSPEDPEVTYNLREHAPKTPLRTTSSQSNAPS